MKKLRTKQKIGLHPVMFLLILSFITIVVSGILGFFNVQATFNKVSSVTGDFQVTTEAVNSLLSLRGFKYIFTTTVSSFANFVPLTSLIILLLGIGIMVKSGFLKTVITILTKRAKKTTVTFVWVLICILACIIGDISYVIFVPLGALLFMYGKRNPFLGIIASFASLSCGSALSVFLTSIDSSLITMTLNNAFILQSNYTINPFAFILVMSILIIILTIIITNVTEGYIARRLPKYEFLEDEIEEENVLDKYKKKGLLLSLSSGAIYILIFIYSIIPGLPLSGYLLDYNQNLYIDKLFSYESFFSQGFVFLVTLFFIILGLAYGIGAKTIRNNKEFIDSLGESLNGVGKVLVMIFAASAFINIFKQSNLGSVVAGAFTNIISNSSFAGLPLVIMLFIGSFITAIFLPNPLSSWNIMSGVVPTLMNVGVAPEFCQLVFRLGSGLSTCITPVLAYFIIYLAYLENYNQSKKPITFWEAIKFQLPYAIMSFLIFLIFIVIWYIVGFPLGIGSGVSL